MKLISRPALSVSLAAAVFMGAFAWNARAQAPAAAPAPSRLAVLDIQKVFGSLTEKGDGDKEIADLFNKTKKDKDAKEDELNKMKDQLLHSAFNPDSKEYKEQQDELLQKSMEYQVFIAVSQQKLVMLQRAKTESIYRTMNEAVRKYAEANGIAIVFVTDDANFSGAENVDQLKAGIAMRKIMYANPMFDITKQIIETMNAAYMRAAH